MLLHMLATCAGLGAMQCNAANAESLNAREVSNSGHRRTQNKGGPLPAAEEVERCGGVAFGSVIPCLGEKACQRSYGGGALVQKAKQRVRLRLKSGRRGLQLTDTCSYAQGPKCMHSTTLLQQTSPHWRGRKRKHKSIPFAGAAHHPCCSYSLLLTFSTPAKARQW